MNARCLTMERPTESKGGAKILPWTSRDKAALSGEFGLNIARGRSLVSPILGTQVPRRKAHTGCWRIGRELAECRNCRQIPGHGNRRSSGAGAGGAPGRNRVISLGWCSVDLAVGRTHISEFLKEMRDAAAEETTHRPQRSG